MPNSLVLLSWVLSARSHSSFFSSFELGPKLARITGGERRHCVCFCAIDTHVCSNESGVILWLQTRLANKRRMLSMASSFPLKSHIHPVCFLPLGLPLLLEQRRGNPLSPSLLMLFQSPFITFVFHSPASLRVNQFQLSAFFSVFRILLVWFCGDTGM